MTKPKFTTGPWKAHGTSQQDFVTTAWEANGGPDSPPTPEYICKCGNDNGFYNAALIAQCPSLYANEEKNLETMRKDIRLLETIAKVCDLNPIVHLTVMAAIVEHQGQVETTEKLLAKCRGEVKDE